MYCHIPVGAQARERRLLLPIELHAQDTAFFGRGGCESRKGMARGSRSQSRDSASSTMISPRPFHESSSDNLTRFSPYRLSSSAFRAPITVDLPNGVQQLKVLGRATLGTLTEVSEFSAKNIPARNLRQSAFWWPSNDSGSVVLLVVMPGFLAHPHHSLPEQRDGT